MYCLCACGRLAAAQNAPSCRKRRGLNKKRE